MAVYGRGLGAVVVFEQPATGSAKHSPLAALPGVHDLQVLDGHVTFAVDDAELPTVLAAVASLRPRSIVANPPSLEELFLRHYGDELAALNEVDR